MLSKKNMKNRKFLMFISCFIIVCIFKSIFDFNVEAVTLTSSVSDIVNNNIAARSEYSSDLIKNNSYLYLSDLDYITTNNWSYNGWSGHSITKDKNQDNGSISLMIDGQKRTFAKGLDIHAKGQATYDISQFSDRFPRFLAYIGVDASMSSRGLIWIQISVSNDGQNWTVLHKTCNMTGSTNAIELDLDVEGYKYLRIYVDPVGANASDHGIIANARFATREFDKDASVIPSIHDTAYYDNILAQHDIEYNMENNYRLILEREVVNKIGYWNIQNLAAVSNDAYDTLMWMFEDTERLEQIIDVGAVNSARFMSDMISIYSKHKEDLKQPNGYVYQKMMIAISAAHSTDPAWTPLSFGGNNTYNVLTRFELIKELFDNDRLLRLTTNNLKGTFVVNDWFKNYSMPLMRNVMHDGISDIDFKWLNGYTHEKCAFDFWVIPYISPNYNQARFYDEANREKYDQKYLLSKYSVPYGSNSGQHFWMVIEGGGICWNESRFGQTMYRVNGIPSVGGYQPAHEMFFNYYQDANGNGYWTGRYGNWSSTGTTWGGGTRHRYPLDWANKYFADKNISGSKGASSSGYLYLAQANLNIYEKYQKSLYYNLVTNSYNDNDRKIEGFFKSLEINKLNLDTYDYIINLYKNMSVKNEGGTITSSDWRDLALKIVDAYTYYPVAMYDLIKVIRPYLEGADRLEIDRLEIESLEKATKATADVTNSAEGARSHANWLLGRTQADPVTFSFDGDNAGKLVRNPNYQIAWGYSLDGGKTFTTQVNVDSVTLTKEEIESITAENDIVITFMGLPDYRFTIDITKGTISNLLYGNDLENRVIAVNNSYEWRFSDNDEWTSYKDGEPDCTGNKTLQVRVGYTGKSIPSDSRTFTFTEDNQPDTAKYIPIKHLKLNRYSSQQDSGSQAAANAIDANINTMWHSAWNGSDDERAIVIELDEVRFISALEYYARRDGGTNGNVRSATISVSLDGTSWTDVVTGTDWANNGQCKRVSFDPAKAKYLKFKANTNYGDGRKFIAATMINLFEDTTVVDVADFSFSGNNSGRIFITDKFKNLDWEYSLDGGTTWKYTEAASHQLTDEEIEQITEENNIKIRFEGDQTEYVIKIKKGKNPQGNTYVNDLENRVFGLNNTNTLEWKIDNGKWKSYQVEEPVVTGTRKLYVRTKAAGTTTASDILEFQFTEDNQPNTRKYIPIKHLTVSAYNSQSKDANRPFYAPNAIDGTINTMWHSTFDQHLKNEGKKAYLVLKLDEPKHIAALEFIQKRYRTADPCLIKTGIVYVSMDGENWTEAGRIENLSQEENVWRIIDFDESMEAQYVKLEMETYDMFASVTMINLFEDLTAKTAATFTLEGENAGKLILLEEFRGSRWQYSIDGGATWKNTTGDEYQFTDEEIDSLTPENGIKLHFDGENKVYSINLQKSERPQVAYLNDLENRLINVQNIENLEWKIEGTNTGWKKYTEEEPVVEGDSKLLVRTIATRNILPSDPVEYQFTEDNQPDTEKYIKLSRVRVSGYSTQQNDSNLSVNSAIDGNINTHWHSLWNGTDQERYIILELDNVTNFSALEYIPRQDDIGGRIRSAKISVSLDGENWTDVVTQTDWANDKTAKKAVLDDSVKAKYIKLTANTNYGDGKYYISASMINLYEDITNEEIVPPTADVEYSTEELTNQDVVVTLVNPNKEITITNNSGSNSYTFIQNGSFTFEFVDKAGNKGTATANVNWIDKDAPTATFTYNVTQNTINPVTAIFSPSEEVTITNNNGNNLYTFTKNGSFTFEFVDRAGNKGTAIATVNWIKDPTKIKVTYSENELTNQDVTATIVSENSNITVTNNNGSNSYTFTQNGDFTFEYTDEYGVSGRETITVDWIDKVAPTGTISYSRKENTINPVTATLTTSEEVTITNNNGNSQYTFDKSGSFTFEFVDRAGNKGTAIATVDWIKDPTKIKVTYSIKELTNEDVVVTIESENSEITVTNNNGNKSYVFETNGTFNFEYIDEYGVSGNMTIMVDWIDKDAPTAEFEYSTRENTINPVTVTLKPSEKVTITNNGGSDTYTFEENGDFTFEFVDEAGNKGTATANVDWIKPTTKVNIEYDIKTLTNKDVVATITSENSKITIDNNDGNNSYTFTQNGDFTFEYTDEYGQKGKAVANVDWIDKDAPTATFNYNITHETVNPVRATLIPNEKVTITNNDGLDYIIFNEDGSFTFEFVDEAGNKGTATATVNWIRKIPGFEFVYSTNELTKDDVEVTLVVSNANITITNNNGSNKHTFTENGNFTFEYIDEYGQKGQTIARVDWIDKTAPTVEIKYNKTTLTNEDVIATLKFSENVTIINKDLKYTKNEDGTYTIVFEKNTNLTLEFEDKVGNKSTKNIDIDWIDKDAPIVELEYSTKNITLDPVTVTLKSNEKIKILNNGGSNTYTFIQNGDFTFEYEDEAGNKGTAAASVNWIRETLKVKLIYSIDTLTNKDVIVTLVTEEDNKYINITNNNGSNTYTFTQNGEFTFEYVGGYGIPNSITAKVDWIDKDAPTSEVTYSDTKATNKDVIATIKFNEEVEILNKDVVIEKQEGNVYTIVFTGNGTKVIEYIDKAGNKGATTLKVNNIDKVAPKAEVKYEVTIPTNEDVIVKLRFSEEVEILNKDVVLERQEDGIYTLAFKENKTIVIEYVDVAGNKSTTTLVVNNIDTVAPIAEVTYSETTLTNKDVTATIKFNEDVRITTEGVTLERIDRNTYKIKFIRNRTQVIEFVDAAGNKGTVSLEVNNIDKIAPIPEVTYSTTEITDKEVIATIKFNEEIEIVTENVDIIKIDNNTYEVKFKDNDEMRIEFKDKAGNVGNTTLKVDWIQILPNISISYNITTETKENVTVTITADDVITIKNNEGKNTYIFNKNGEFIFEYVDKYGNEGKAIAKVDWIIEDSEEPISPIDPIKPSEDEKDKPSDNQEKINENYSHKNIPIVYIPNYSQVTNVSDKKNNNLKESEYNYSQGEILVKISTEQDIKNATLINKKLTISEGVKNLVGNLSEQLQIYLVNGNQDRIDLDASDIIIIFKLDPTKVFDGIYKIKEDETLEKIDYKYVDKESIEINTKEFGEYILSYNKKQDENELQQANKVDILKDNKEKLIKIITIALVIIGLVGIIVLIVKRRKENKDNY